MNGREFVGMSTDSFPKQRLVIEPVAWSVIILQMPCATIASQLFKSLQCQQLYKQLTLLFFHHISKKQGLFRGF